MKKYMLIFMAALVFGCGGSTTKPEQTGTPQTYWVDDDAKLGLQIDAGSAMLHLGNKEYYATGVNCYDLFVSGITKEGDGYKFDTATPYKTLEVLKKHGVTVLRFSCIEFYAQDFPAYFDHKEEYLALLKSIAERAEEYHIGLIPSFF